jgi:hypothetical protein
MLSRSRATGHSCMLQYGLRGEVTGRGQSNRRIFRLRWRSIALRMRHVCRHTTIQNPAYIFETVNLNYQCVERLKSNYSQTARKLFLISLFVRISSQRPYDSPTIQPHVRRVLPQAFQAMAPLREFQRHALTLR